MYINKKKIRLPIYFPDATRAVVKSLSPLDVQKCGIKGLVINTYHLQFEPGKELLKEIGGVGKFMNWSGFLASDSGGFQLYSLINKDSSFGKINDKSIIFYKDSLGQKGKFEFTPEKSIQVQFALGADIMICLDDFTPEFSSRKKAELSVERTIKWARRCKTEFEQQVESKKLKSGFKPLLFAPVQGGEYKDLRKKCAEELERIGFDGYGLGGWPFKKDGGLDLDICKYVAEVTPDHKPRFALGIGKPDDIVNCGKFGYDIFDCVLPTRDARHGRLYVWRNNPKDIDLFAKTLFYDYLYVKRGRYSTEFKSIDKYCDCELCQNYSRAYLHHLFKIGDTSAGRLASIHNLRFYARLIELLRELEIRG